MNSYEAFIFKLRSNLQIQAKSSISAQLRTWNSETYGLEELGI